MLSSEELTAWYERLNFSPETRSVIDRVRSSEPARRVGGGVPEGFQYTALRKDGSTFPALVHTTVVMKDSRPCGVQGYLIDISERVRAENALRRRVALAHRHQLPPAAEVWETLAPSLRDRYLRLDRDLKSGMCITIEPGWAKLLDFETRMPSAVAGLIDERA